uniref:Uncharacterized protein n=1 Tax=Kalanchoe fedtschenkoi TaxID=63787 RepID=A0A7N0ZUR1_KALFE
MGEPACGSEVVAEKRRGAEAGDPFGHEKKRLKMDDFDSFLRSKEVANNRSHVSEEDVSCIAKETAINNLDAAKVPRSCMETAPVLRRSHFKVVDMTKKTDDAVAVQSVVGVADRTALLKKNDKVPNIGPSTAKEVGISMEKDIVCSATSNPVYPCKKVSRAKCAHLSECGSVTGPVATKDPLEVWKEMKQNGFLSSTQSHKVVTIPPVKSRQRKNKADVMKKKMEQAKIEQAKKEQVDRFTKIAAPSGLLNDLNPGIINHVRNSKQVHSILKALVRPERHDATANKSSNNGKSKETKERMEIERSSNLGLDHHTRHEKGFGNSFAPSRKTSGYPSALDHFKTSARENEVGLQCRVDTEIGNQTSIMFSDCKKEEFNFSSSARKMSENASSISNENNQSCVSSLSVKAASVASQWLELLQQDIKGRLAALRRSKQRVRAVLQTELPHLLSNEFPCNQENEPHSVTSLDLDSRNSTAELHEVRWNSLFGQMDTSLTDEEQQLVTGWSK